MPFKPALGVSRQALDDGGVTQSRSGYEDDGDAVAGNIRIAVPIVSLPGRGIDLNLTMYYNSLTPTQPSQRFTDQETGDWPAHGWYLGFGKLRSVELMDSDGTKHPLQWIDEGHRRTSDGTLIDIEDEACSVDMCQSIVHYPNGGQVEFSGPNTQYGDGAYYDRHPTKIVDRNGNFLTISYRSIRSEALTAIVDTVGRRMVFDYDDKFNLIGITAPMGGLVKLHYGHAAPFEIAKYEKNKEGGGDLGYLVDAIYFPENSTGLWFGGAHRVSGHVGQDQSDPRSGCCYTFDGKLDTFNWQVGMQLDNASHTEQGTVSNPGTTIRNRKFYFGTDTVTNTPYISKISDAWAGNSTIAVTQIDIKHKDQSREVTITYPDRSRNLQAASEITGQIDTGLVSRNVVLSPSGQTLSTQITQWEAGLDGTPRVHRVETQDGLGLATAIVFEYGPRNEVIATNEQGFDGSLLRRTATGYLADPRLEAQHILNLPSSKVTYAGSSATPIARTDFAYDESPLDPTPLVGQHSAAFDPDQMPADAYQHTVRGNLTSTTAYADAAGAHMPMVVHQRYDICGNVVSSSQWAGAETRYSYSLATQFAYPDSVSTGSDDPKSPVRMSFAYTYRMDTGQPETYIDANGIKTTFQFTPMTTDVRQIDTAGKPLTLVQRYYQNQTTRLQTQDRTGVILTDTLAQFDGLGQIIRTDTLAVSGGTNSQQFQYGFSGQVISESLPYASASTDIQWVNYAYDALGRLTTSRAPDGSVNQRFYDQATRPMAADNRAGHGVLVQDAWGRQRWRLIDALGRIAEVVEPDPAVTQNLFQGNGFLTKYDYDVLGNLTLATEGGQTREFVYDSLSRLIAQRVPEKSATLLDTGQYAESPAIGRWSETRSYDERTGQIALITDARGIRTLFDYGNDPLGRIQTLSYANSRVLAKLTGLGGHAPPFWASVIAVPPTVYHYKNTGDLFRPSDISSGLIDEAYGYDAFSQIKSVTTGIDASLINVPPPATLAPNTPAGILIDRKLRLKTLYDYDAIGQLQTLRASAVPPFQDPNGILRPSLTAPDSITFRWGPDRKLLGVEIAPRDFGGGWALSHFTYNAAGQMLTRDFTLPFVFDGIGETFSYGAKDGLLKEHTASRIGIPPKRFYDTSFDYRPPSKFPFSLSIRPEVGQVTQQMDAVNTDQGQKYTYDKLGHLATATLGSGFGGTFESRQVYTYDQYGNRIDVSAVAPPTTCALPPCALPNVLHDGWPVLSADPDTNHIVQTDMSYDETGNVLSAPTPAGVPQRYQYDDAGRLVTVYSQAGVILEHYMYGADRRRLVTIDAKGQATTSTWDGETSIVEHEIATGAHRFYAYNQNGAYAMFSTDALGIQNIQYRLSDRHMIREVIDIGGFNALGGGRSWTEVPINTRPFGVAPPGTAALKEYLQGYQRSAVTGLDYALNRFYDPWSGRFLEPDPLGADAASLAMPQSLNLYSYVVNDPINNVDPEGLLAPVVKSGCGMYPGDSWGIGGCTSAAGAVGLDAIGDTSPSGDGWGLNNDQLRLFRLASSARFDESLNQQQREAILNALVFMEITPAGKLLADVIGPDEIWFGRLYRANASGNPDTREVLLGLPFMQGANGKVGTYTTAAGNYPYTLDRILAHELGHLTRIYDIGPGNMANVNVWENSIMRGLAPWQPDRTAY